MAAMEQAFLKIISKNNLIKKGQTLLIAVSGGPDSTALLCLLASLLPKTVKAAAYIDHNLRPKETKAEVEHVKELCITHNIHFEYKSINVIKEKEATGESIEACARRLRYCALESIRKAVGADLIATGHTADDQAEELLIRLIRGSGLKGLAGMNQVNNTIIRPLLLITKNDILGYLEHKRFSYCQDSTNFSRTYLRNRVRLDLLPLLEASFNPSIRQTLVNTSTILHDDDCYLEQETDHCYHNIVSEAEFLQKGVTKELSYNVDSFLQLHPAIQRRILEKMCWQSGCKPSFKAIENIRQLTRSGSSGSEIHLPKGLTILKTADTLFFLLYPRNHFLRHRQKESFSETITIDLPGRYEVSSLEKTFIVEKTDILDNKYDSNLHLDADLITFPLILRKPEQGESFTPLGAPGTKKISRYFSDKKIPSHLRYRYPVIVSDETIIAIPGLAISDHVKVTSQTANYISLLWEDRSARSDS